MQAAMGLFEQLPPKPGSQGVRVEGPLCKRMFFHYRPVSESPLLEDHSFCINIS